jgi:Ser/Thr protein kinase RdoA (MazF antagonist)
MKESTHDSPRNHIAAYDTVTVFDFDCGGPGWWAHDLAGFRHEGALASQGDNVWEAFFRGYMERRGVSELDLQAIPVLVAIRQVWLMGMRISNIEHLGYSWIDDAYKRHCVSHHSLGEQSQRLQGF